MAAIISDKFRVYNAKQFLGALTAPTPTRLYFFVGRPQEWYSTLEYYGAGGFAAGDSITATGTPFTADVVDVYENYLILTNIGPAITAVPDEGATITGGVGTGNVITYRFGSEDIPTPPLDNSEEKLAVYDDIIAAKRVTDDLARAVIKKYVWANNNTVYDMYRHDYAPTVSTGSARSLGTLTDSTGLGTIVDSQFYTLNGDEYSVWKCLYNAGATPSTDQPVVSGIDGDGIFTGADGYKWILMYEIPTNDVIKFLSTDFMPINQAGEASVVAANSRAVNGAIDAVVIEDGASGFPASLSGTLYAVVNGDGNSGAQAVVQFDTTAGGVLTNPRIIDRSSGYTYGTILNETGATVTGLEKKGFYENGGTVNTAGDLLTPAASVGEARISVIIGPEGGHGSDPVSELNAKRIMTNVRLEYREGAGDFPVDNDFRRIGLLQDPLDSLGSDLTADTASGLKYIAVAGGDTTNFTQDETITQTRADGTIAKGTVVSYLPDDPNTPSTDGVLRYYQNSEEHTDDGRVRAFEVTGANPIVGSVSGASKNGDNSRTDIEVGTNYDGDFAGGELTAGEADSEILNNSGDIIYLENRRLITRAEDQIEDIKLVIEF